MPAVSITQQKLFGLAVCYKKGECKKEDVSDEVIKLADSMTLKKLEDFAKTKHEGLPDKVKENLIMRFKQFCDKIDN